MTHPEPVFVATMLNTHPAEVRAIAATLPTDPIDHLPLARVWECWSMLCAASDTASPVDVLPTLIDRRVIRRHEAPTYRDLLIELVAIHNPHGPGPAVTALLEHAARRHARTHGKALVRLGGDTATPLGPLMRVTGRLTALLDEIHTLTVRNAR